MTNCFLFATDKNDFRDRISTCVCAIAVLIVSNGLNIFQHPQSLESMKYQFKLISDTRKQLLTFFNASMFAKDWPLYVPIIPLKKAFMIFYLGKWKLVQIFFLLWTRIRPNFGVSNDYCTSNPLAWKLQKYKFHSIVAAFLEQLSYHLWHITFSFLRNNLFLRKQKPQN